MTDGLFLTGALVKIDMDEGGPRPVPWKEQLCSQAL